MTFELPNLPPWSKSVAWSLSPRVSVLLATLAVVSGGGVLGAVVAQGGPFPGLALLAGVVTGIVLSSDLRAGLWLYVSLAALLPYAVIPVKVVVTPPVLELTGLALLLLWIVTLLLQRDFLIDGHPMLLAAVIFLLMTLFAFVLGIDRGYTTTTYHDYAKFLVSASMFFVAWTVWRSVADVVRFTTVLLVATSVAALVGLVLYAGGPTFTLAVLARLIPYGYPSERIVRFIEDDPAKPMRLTSTSVDPNSFAGLLSLVLVLAIAQSVARRSLIPRWLSLGTAAVTGTALLLTYSRAGWLGAVAGIAIIAVLRYRWLLLSGSLGVGAAIGFGIGEGFFERLWQGFRLQDRATQMRLEEYRTALAILREYPAFGVGFGQAPTVELWTGVSSIYLLVAERMGLLGLVAFLWFVLGIAWRGFLAWRSSGWSAENDLLLGWWAALVAALVIGSFDHYYVNISFPHMVAVFWLALAAVLKLAVLCCRGSSELVGSEGGTRSS